MASDNKFMVRTRTPFLGFPGISKDDFDYGVYATEDIEIAEIVVRLSGNWIVEPSRTSIQIGERHLESSTGGYVNHHCDPNCVVLCNLVDLTLTERLVPIDVKIKGSLTSMMISNPKPVLVAIKPILKDEEITFDYNTTESNLANPFKCNCHGNWIRGKVHRFQE